MTYAFVFDASACTGCKACQLACKDKNHLPVEVLWRRVYEVTGGSWQQQGAAWSNTIFGSNLSLACNHCVHPKCAGVCPVDAYVTRPDGIVYIDTSLCTGCGYCSWACPYSAPQADTKAGVYSKCDLCRDYLDQDLPPACVAACPMRCLNLVEVQEDDTQLGGTPLWKVPGEEHPFPLPAFSRTEPHLVIHPHLSSTRKGEQAQVTNREEVTTADSRSSSRREIPLVFFTLLSQAAVGTLGTTFGLSFLFHSLLDIRINLLLPLLAAPANTLVALLVAFLHLGKPHNAWRMIQHQGKSWLSRELLVISLFTGLSILLAGLTCWLVGSQRTWQMASGVTLLVGINLVWFEHSVYRLHSVAEWDTYRTLGAFAASALILGSLLTGLLLPADLLPMLLPGLAMTSAIGTLASFVLNRTNKTTGDRQPKAWNAWLLLAAMLLLLQVALLPGIPLKPMLLLVFLTALLAEIFGRMEFYLRRKPGI